MNTKVQIEEALILYENHDLLDLDDFPEEAHDLVGRMFQRIIVAGLGYGPHQSIELDIPSSCDLNEKGKRQRDLLFRKQG